MRASCMYQFQTVNNVLSCLILQLIAKIKINYSGAWIYRQYSQREPKYIILCSDRSIEFRGCSEKKMKKNVRRKDLQTLRLVSLVKRFVWSARRAQSSVSRVFFTPKLPLKPIFTSCLTLYCSCNILIASKSHLVLAQSLPTLIVYNL